ncbi:hypothetical protein [Streptomyces minutiscleroticus]|uniref:hypothetical protein n=1 Tax=Streptomyces minutiscleroticus TaxID=68238 RepID=UPI00167D0119|nr:hypothetical protein [Streptomyces minutiscleroticus]
MPEPEQAPEPGRPPEPEQAPEPEPEPERDPAAPAPLDVPRTPTGDAGIDARLARLSDVDHLATDGHVAVYEDVHRGLRDALTELDTRPGPPGPQGPPGPAGPPAPRPARSGTHAPSDIPGNTPSNRS